MNLPAGMSLFVMSLNIIIIKTCVFLASLLYYLLHAKNFGVKIDRGLGILNTDHGVVEDILGGIGGHFCL